MSGRRPSPAGEMTVWPERVTGRGPDDPGGALLAPLQQAATLSPVQLERGLERLQLQHSARVARAPGRWPGRMALAAAMIVGVVIGAALMRALQPPGRGGDRSLPERGTVATLPDGGPPAPPIAGHRDEEVIQVPACSVQALAATDPSGALNLVGPARALRPPGGRPVRLVEGRLHAIARQAPLWVETPALRISARPGATVELSVEVARTIIAAHGASVEVERREPPLRLVVEPGTAVTVDGRTQSTRTEAVSVPEDPGPGGDAWSGLLKRSCEAAPSAASAPPVAAPPAPAAAVAPPAAAPPPGPPLEPAPSAAPSTPAAVNPSPTRARLPLAVASGDGPLAQEAELVARAQHGLRGSSRDVPRALAALEQHRRRFPSGLLAPERDVLQLEGLLLIGRRIEALRLLRGLSLERHARGRELHVLRGELLAGRPEGCAAAVADFTAALVGDGSGLEERALFGRGSCRLALGEVAAGDADLARYLERFPTGRQAAAVRRRLEARAAERRKVPGRGGDTGQAQRSGSP